jgi:hypothetical protein
MTRRDAPDERNLLDRILNTPQLAQVVPRHQPELFHRVIQSCGLEDCAEIVAPATPEQSAHIFDLDLWRPARPGPDEQFDPDRFGVWLEVLVESGAAAAAQKLPEVDVNLVIAGLAQRRLVYDRAAVTTYETTDGEWIDAIRVVDDGLTFDVGGYLLMARRADSREAIVAILPCLADRRRAPRLDHIRARLEFALDRDQAAYSARNEELAYLANCSIQARPFTAH